MKKVMMMLFLALVMVMSSCRKEDVNPFNSENQTRGRSERGFPQATCTFCLGMDKTGGGTDYSNILTTGDSLVQSPLNGVTQTPQQLGLKLASLVSTAQNGQVIYIDIEPTNYVEVQGTIEILNEITIAGNRGLNGSSGPLIRPGSQSSPMHGLPVFLVRSNNVRITGLNLKGWGNYTWGIFADGRNESVNLEIDNNELSGWGEAIRISEFEIPSGSSNPNLLTEDAFLIHHNHIHDNVHLSGQGPGGYGVAVNTAFAQIYGNYFIENRHDVSGSGIDHSGYNLYCNVFGESSTLVSNVDMHGAQGQTEAFAGGFMHIHHNDFLDRNPQGNIIPTGRPDVLMLIDNNKFVTSEIFGNGSVEAAIAQINNGGPNPQPTPDHFWGGIVAVNNIYNDKYLGWYVREEWDPNATNNFIRIPSTNDFLHCMLNPGTVSLTDVWTTLYDPGYPNELDYYFGDFNGDGNTDIFRSIENSGQGTWEYLPLNTDYANNWLHLSYSNVKPGIMSRLNGTSAIFNYQPTMLLTNTNADAVTDAFWPTGTQWNTSYSCNSNWISVASSTYTLTNTICGKFFKFGYNNNILDVFMVNGGQGYMSYDFTSWSAVANVSGNPFGNLRAGDMNGDGNDDIFVHNGNSWLYWNNALGSPVYLRPAIGTLSYSILGDFNFDQRTDVIHQLGGVWYVSLQGITSSYPLNISFFPLVSFDYGDLY